MNKVEAACRTFCFAEGCDHCANLEACDCWDAYENPMRAALEVVGVFESEGAK